MWASRDAEARRFVAAFEEALKANAALVQPGDTVLVHPPWRDDVVAVLRAQGVTATEAFAPRHGDPWPSLVVVADASWPLPAVLRRRVGEVFSHEGIEVFRIANDDAAAGFDLARARVSVSGPEGEVECPWDPGRRRHVCEGLPEWMTVGEDTLTIEGRGQRCMWAHPKTNHTLLIDYGVVDVDVVTLSLALTDGAAANPTGAAVQARLLVGGDREQTVTVQRERGFHDVAIDARGKHPVRLELTTKNDGQRHTCFKLRSGQQ
ncbi:MAG: hypothetical protein Q8O67_19705 [Deltaproteobacteria bacterium]|nr:hypothetical protein [Deltaproteobacteria bacterium]